MVRIAFNKSRRKYNAKPTQVDGINFPSQKEARYYNDLKIRQRLGDVLHFHRQVKFDLPGGLTYACDFQIFEKTDTGIVCRYIDVKGSKKGDTYARFIRNKKMVEDIYGVEIEEA